MRGVTATAARVEDLMLSSLLVLSLCFFSPLTACSPCRVHVGASAAAAVVGSAAGAALVLAAAQGSCSGSRHAVMRQINPREETPAADGY